MLLPKAELSKQYPDLWSTPKRAGKWLEKKPLECSIGIIRKWGPLVEYRPEGQKSWSKAIVRNGVRNQETIIEFVLGLPSGSVVTRSVANKD